MKKIFTLFACAFAALSANAQVTTIFQGTIEAPDWNASVTVADSKVQELVANGTIKIGSIISFEGKKTASDYCSIALINSSWTSLIDGTTGDGRTTLRFEDGESSTARFEVTQVFLDQVKGGFHLNGHGYTIREIKTQAPRSYKAAVDLSSQVDEWNKIRANAFNGYSDNARVRLTCTAAGTEKYPGWGIGDVVSLAGNVKVGSLVPSGDGDFTTTFDFSELRPALLDGPDENGNYGLFFNLYGQTSNGTVCTCTFKSLTIEEVSDFTGEGFVAPTSLELIHTGAIAKTVKKIINGQIILEKNGLRYNLLGQPLK